MLMHGMNTNVNCCIRFINSQPLNLAPT